MRIVLRMAAIALAVGIAAATSSTSAAAGSIICVRGSDVTVEPPLACPTFDNLYDANNNSTPASELRVYGTVTLDRGTLSLVARTLTGFSGAKLDARKLDGVAIVVRQTAILNNFTLFTSGCCQNAPGTSIGILLSNPEKAATLNGVSVIGGCTAPDRSKCPPGVGFGIGIYATPGAGRLTIYGNTQDSEFSGHWIGVLAWDPQGRPSVNGAKNLSVKISDVLVGIVDSVSVPAQWFKTKISCGRPNAIGYHGINSEHSDLNGLVITDCTVGLQLECVGEACGGGREFDNLQVGTRDNPVPIPVRIYLPDGSAVDDYKADLGCGDAWGISTSLNGVPLPESFVVTCP